MTHYFSNSFYHIARQTGDIIIENEKYFLGYSEENADINDNGKAFSSAKNKGLFRNTDTADKFRFEKADAKTLKIRTEKNLPLLEMVIV